MGVYMLTTVDNPWNPFTNFSEWFAFDERMGYSTSGLLARVTMMSSDLSEADQELEIENAMREVARINASGMHTLVAEPGSGQ